MQFTTSYIIAASQLFAFALGAPILTSSAQEARGLVERSAYKVFGGDGSAAQGWPQESDWKSFEDLWKANQNIISGSCKQFNQENNSPEETANIKKAISQVSKESKLPDSYLFAIMMQESKGCVRAPTTNYGYPNPGLMQSFQGSNTCFNVNPCPADKIVGMISDGAKANSGVGLVEAISKVGSSGSQAYYRAARHYNSGSVDPSGNLGAGIATHCYASDVANRLIGWADDTTGCKEDTIAGVSGSAPSGGSSSTTPTTPTTPSSSTTPASPATSSKPPTTGSNGNSTPSTSSTTASGPKAAGASASCKKWYTAKAGDSCSSTGISLAELTKLNTGLNAQCTNLFAGTAYCVGA